MSKKKNPRRVRTDATERSKKPFARHETDYEGVWYRIGTHRGTGKKEKIFYVVFNRGGKRIETRVGREKQDGMTASLASRKRAEMIDGNLKPRKEELKDEAAEKAAETSRWTLDKLWAAWMADPENRDKRGTFKADQRYRKHISAAPDDVKNRKKGAPPPLGDREPKDLVPTDIDRLRLYLAKDHAKATVISILGLVRRIERYGAATGRCAGLSFPIVLRGKTLGREPEVKKAPSDEQVETYIKTCMAWPDRQAGNFQLFIAYTGIRRGSVQRLRWEDIDLDNQSAVLKDSKTGDVQIVLSEDAVALLRNHPREMMSPYVFTGKGWEDVLDKAGNPIMRKKNGKMRKMKTEKNLPQLTQRQIDRIPRMIADEAGLPADLDPCHAFRRRLATKVEEKFGIATAMKAGGWKSPAMVINYTATTKQTLRDAVNLMGRKPAEPKAAPNAEKKQTA